MVLEWGYNSSYPAGGGTYWTYPIALNTKVYHITVTQIYNNFSHSEDGNERVRTYTTTQANFANGSSSSALPMFFMVIGY